MTESTSFWQRLIPFEGGVQDDILAQVARVLEEEGTRRELQALADAERYPATVLARLRACGLAELFADSARTTPWHLGALNELTARADGSLAITVGVNALALLPIWLSGDAKQQAYVAARLREGAAASLLLTELPHGSNLARAEASAERGTLDGETFRADARASPAHYRLRGEKHLINGASEHDLLVTLLRTRPADPTRAGQRLSGLADFTVFIIERKHGVEVLPRWRTLPAQGADIAGVRFDGAVVSGECIVGREGDGLSLIYRTLVLSRGGIGALAAGTAARAFDLALARARSRDVYGAPIVQFGAISEHLLRLELAALASAALSLKATAYANAGGQAAATLTAAAKVVCTALAEEAVTEGRRVLGSQALLRENPFERLVRDVLLFPVFDGTSHVMLEELAGRLAQAAREGDSAVTPEDCLRALGQCYRHRPRSFCEPPSARPVQTVASLESHARAIASVGDVDVRAIVPLTRALLSLTRTLQSSGYWEDQAVRFRASLSFALLHALFAGLELSDPGRRRALDLPSAKLDAADGRRAALLLARLGGRVLRRTRELALACDAADSIRELDGLEEQLRKGESITARRHHQDYQSSAT